MCRHGNVKRRVWLGCAQIQDDLKVLRHEVLRSGEAGVQLPVNLKRLIWNAQQIFHCQPHRRGPSGAPAPEPVKRPIQTLCKYSSVILNGVCSLCCQ